MIRKGNAIWGKSWATAASGKETHLHNTPLLHGSNQKLLGLWLQLVLRGSIGFRATISAKIYAMATTG